MTPTTKALFVDYLWQTYRYGKMDIKRNFGYAVNPNDATLLVYFDAGHEGIMYICHLMYETKTPGIFHTEFLFASHCLVPSGRNVPHSELDGAYKASRQTEQVILWFGSFIKNRALMGDAEICLYWILNRHRRTSTFIRNRAHAMNRAFSDEQIFHIPTESNPANIATKFETGKTLPNGFQNSYKELGDGSAFRSGPPFMKYGLKKAITNKNITNIGDMKVSLANKRIARRQWIGIDNKDKDEVDDEQPLGHIVFVATTADSHDNNIDDETVLLTTNPSKEPQPQNPHAFPGDGSISEQIANRVHFSKYLVNPARTSYNKMFDATTVTLLALQTLLRSPKTTPKLSEAADRLQFSPDLDKENHFMLDRDSNDGALYQKLRHSQIQSLEKSVYQLQTPGKENEAATSQMNTLEENRRSRLDKLQADPTHLTQAEWKKRDR